MTDFETKLRWLSERGNPVGAEEMIERIEADLAGDPLVVVNKRREGRLMTKTQQSRTTSRPSRYRGPAWALVALVAVLAAGGLALALRGNEQVAEPTTVPAPTTVPTTAAKPTASGGMWPQSNLEEVQEAQELADAGDPDYTWQLDGEIANGNSPNAEIVARFIREELGWEEFIFNGWVGWEHPDTNLTYMKCAPGETNPIYPEDEYAGECAPTIDDLQYETVIIDLAQPVRSDPTGIWVVSGWTMGPSFAQSDPGQVQAGATALLDEFLEARIAGEGAEGYVDVRQRVFGTLDEVPLLYSTSSGAPYERYEIDVVGGPHWPYGDLEFDVRLLADGGETVVEQPFNWSGSRLDHDVTETKENGQPVGVPFAFFDGEVLLTAAKPWVGGFERNSLDLGDPLDLRDQEAIVLVGDPLPVATGCAIGPTPVDADALARSLESDPDLQVTAPVAVSVGGIDALTMDIVLAPEADDCDAALRLRDDPYTRRWGPLDRGSHMRLYLFDMPEGSSMRILAIAIVAPEARFDAVIEAATPVMDSIEFIGQ